MPTTYNPDREREIVRALANHRSALNLTSLGLTEDILFRSRLKISKEFPYWMWNIVTDPIVSMSNSTELFYHLKIYCTWKWLRSEPPEGTPGMSEAWEAVALYDAEPDLNAGRRHREAQQARAKRPRDTITEDGVTLREIIGTLACNHPDERPSEVWPHFISKLEQLGLDPAEKPGKVHYSNRR